MHACLQNVRVYFCVCYTEGLASVCGSGGIASRRTGSTCAEQRSGNANKRRAEAEKARVWFQEQMDLRFCARIAGRHITPDMARLEAEFGRSVCAGLPALMPIAGPGA